MKKRKLIIAALILLIASTFSATLSSFSNGDSLPEDKTLVLKNGDQTTADLSQSNVLDLTIQLPQAPLGTAESGTDVDRLGVDLPKDEAPQAEVYQLNLPAGFQLLQSDQPQAITTVSDHLEIDGGKLSQRQVQVMLQGDTKKVSATNELRVVRYLDQKPVSQSAPLTVTNQPATEETASSSPETSNPATAATTETTASDTKEADAAKKQAADLDLELVAGGNNYGTEADWHPTTTSQMKQYMNTDAAINVSNEAEWIAAWKNPKMHLINLTNNIMITQTITASVKDGSTFIVNGNGFAIENRQLTPIAVFPASANQSNIVLQNINLYSPHSLNAFSFKTQNVYLHNFSLYGASLVDSWTWAGASGTSDQIESADYSGNIKITPDDYTSPIDNSKQLIDYTNFTVSGTRTSLISLKARAKTVIQDNANIQIYTIGPTQGGLWTGLSFSLGKHVTVNIDTSKINSAKFSRQSFGYGKIILMGGSAAVLNGEGSTIKIHLTKDFVLGPQDPNILFQQITVTNNCRFIVEADGVVVNTTNNNLMQVTSLNIDSGGQVELNGNNFNGWMLYNGSINVAKGGVFSYRSENSGSGSRLSRINIGIKIDHPKRVEFWSDSTSVDVLAGLSLTMSSTSALDWKQGNNSEQASFGWAPINNISGTTMIYGGVPRFTSLTSADAAIVKSMNDNRMGSSSRRLLFKNIGDLAVNLDDNLTDNLTTVNSHVVTGTTVPNAYIRLSGSVLNASDNKVPLVLDSAHQGFVIPDDWKGNYTVQADASGKFSYDLWQNGDKTRHFTAGEQVTAYGVSIDQLNNGNGNTVTVKDATPPTATGLTIYGVQGQTTFPSYDKWVKNPQDSNPHNTGITATWSTANAQTAAAMAQNAGEYPALITLADAAGNKADIQAKLIIKAKASWIEAAAVNTTMDQIGPLNDADYQKLLLTLAKAKAYRVNSVAGTISDVSGELVVDPLPVKSPDTKEMTLKVPKDGSSLTVGLTIKEWGPTSPKNPANPSQEAPAKENGGTGATGALRLDYVPSLFDFGSVPFEYAAKTYHAKAAKDMTDPNKTAQQWVQVSDNQDVNRQWRLTVKQQQDFNNQTLDLKGTELQLPKGTLRNSASGASEITSGLTSYSQLVLYPGSPDQVVMASDGTIKETSVAGWDPTAVTLKVPYGYKAKGTVYSTDLQWTLQTVPTNQTVK